MPVAAPCPDAALLLKFALGQILPEEVERLAPHIEQCAACTRALEGLKGTDTLVEAMSSLPTVDDEPAGEAMNALIEHLKGLRPAAVAGVEVTRTTAADSTPSSEGERPAADRTQDLCAFLSPAQGPGEIGRLGGYRVLKLLGQGGMGLVFLAEDPRLQRPVALKVMKPDVARNPTARERFLREARAAARLKSDHVVTIHQVGEDNGVVFLAMELLEGMSLDQWLKKGRRPTPAQAARVGRQIALGLAAAHERGLIHRDVKPGNVWLESAQKGRVKLLDFGLARGAADEPHLTRPGAIVGTPSYMAPEQARGEAVDTRADLFSLGCVLYRLTTGQLPFRGETTLAVLTALAVDTPAPPREVNADVPPRLAVLIERLLAKDREQRPATARAVADELAAIEHAAAPAPPRPGPAAGRSRPRRRLLVAAGLLFLLAAAAAGIVVIIRDRQGREVARLEVPEGGSVEVKDEAKGKPAAKGKRAPKVGMWIEPPPLPPPVPGEPLARTALVSRPARLRGVRSWTIEPRVAWFPTALAYRPDGRRLAVGSEDGSIRIWEPQTGRLVQLLLGQNSVLGLAWSPDGRLLAAGGYGDSKPVQLWDAVTGRSLRVLEAPAREQVMVLAWSPDGRRLLAWGNFSHACFTWDASDGKLLHNVPVACGFPVAFAPDGRRLAATRDAGDAVVILDVATGRELADLPVPPGRGLGGLDWSSDGKRLACSSAKGLRAWEVETRKECFTQQRGDAYGAVRWAPDGKALAFAVNGRPPGVAVVDVAPGAKARRLDDAYGNVLAWSPDGRTIARLCTTQGAPIWVRLYDLATKARRSLSESSSGETTFALSPDGRVVAAWQYQLLTHRYHTHTWLASVDTGRALAVLPDGGPTLAWSPTGKVLVSGGAHNRTALWGPDGKPQELPVALRAQGLSLAWSSDGRRLALTPVLKPEGDKRVLLWDFEKGERLGELGPFAAQVEQLAWLPGGRGIACYVNNVGWHFWDVQRNCLLNDPKQWQGGHALFLPDGRCLATVGYNHPYRLRDVATGKEREHNVPKCDSLFVASACSADGRVVVLAPGPTVEVWSGDLRRRLRTLQRASVLEYKQVAVSADGKRVVGLSGARLHVWDADTGRLCGTLLLGPTWHDLAVTLEGHYRGDDQVERGIVMVVQKDDGTQEVLEPAAFARRCGWHNDPAKVRLLPAAR
jgi:WD40 repeat protein